MFTTFQQKVPIFLKAHTYLAVVARSTKNSRFVLLAFFKK